MLTSPGALVDPPPVEHPAISNAPMNIAIVRDLSTAEKPAIYLPPPFRPLARGASVADKA
jgi:hypothetical protein